MLALTSTTLSLFSTGTNIAQLSRSGSGDSGLDWDEETPVARLEETEI